MFSIVPAESSRLDPSTKDRRRFVTLHDESQEIFTVKIEELMEAGRLFLRPSGFG